MPRRRALTRAQLEGLLALPTTGPNLVRHWTLGNADLAAVERRRGDHNRLGFALQLCAFRFPGRLLRPGEAIPEATLRFVAEQVGVGAEALVDYARRPQTRREQLDALRATFGFRMFAPERRGNVAAWLLPVALATTDAAAVASALMEELRRRRIVARGRSVLERLVGAAMLGAERHVARHLTRGLTADQKAALEALLGSKEGTPTSVLAWVRRPPGTPGHGALADLVAQLERLRAVGLFDRAVGRMFRRAKIGEQDALLRDARAVNDKVRLLARLGVALIEARNANADLEAAVADAVGWDRLARSVAEAERLARPDRADLPALAARAWPVLHRLGPLFLGAFRLRAVPTAAATLRAVDALREVYAAGGGRWRPQSLPTSFLRPAWREAVQAAGADARRVWEAATLLALRDRLRAGDVWVEDSRQWRAVEGSRHRTDAGITLSGTDRER